MYRMFLLLCVSVLVSSCSKDNREGGSPQPNESIKPFEVTIDWVPSPEYYGFFVAKQEGFYKKAGLDVTIKYGSGAPVVANQVAVGTIYAGTTTSDNVLRQVALGADFSQVVPLLKFNPTVLVSLKEKPIADLKQMNGKTIGLNKQSSVYQQMQFLIEKSPQLDWKTVKEYPIGWGGGQQLEVGEVDAILAYATNTALDLKIKKVQVEELFFRNAGIHLYGLVLAFAGQKTVLGNGLDSSDLAKFVAATKEGYAFGEKNPSLAAKALRSTEPTLDSVKIMAAIQRIGELNQTMVSDFAQLDRWLMGGKISESALEKTKLLYRQ